MSYGDASAQELFPAEAAREPPTREFPAASALLAALHCLWVLFLQVSLQSRMICQDCALSRQRSRVLGMALGYLNALNWKDYQFIMSWILGEGPGTTRAQQGLNFRRWRPIVNRPRVVLLAVRAPKRRRPLFALEGDVHGGAVSTVGRLVGKGARAYLGKEMKGI